MDSPLIKALQFFLKSNPDTTYWVGYSGGMDSHVLLHILATMRATIPFKLKAIHIHHGLSVNADAWLTHCACICSNMDVEFITKKISLKNKLGDSLEAKARDERYQFVKTLLSENDCFLTAHHQDDQAETVLLQLLRGAGVRGLAAMPYNKKLGKGHHVRPFLAFPRHELLAYAILHQLKWIEDESNQAIQFDRNFLRHQIIPLLKEKWPNLAETFSRSARHCAEHEELLNSFLEQKIIHSDSLSVSYLKRHSFSYQKLILRAWLNHQSIVLPSSKKMQTMIQTLLNAKKDKNPAIKWGEYEIYRYQDHLHVRCCTWHDNQWSCEWDFQQPLMIPSIGQLRTIVTQEWGLLNDIGLVSVCFRQGGEKIRLPGRTFKHSLKKLFQEWKVPVWKRDRIPLLYKGNELVAVVGYGIAADYCVRGGIIPVIEMDPCSPPLWG